LRILIELPTWIGDGVMTTPAIENIVEHFQISDVVFLGSKNCLELFKYHPNGKQYIELKRKISFFKTLSDIGNFDYYFSFRGSTRSKIMKFFVKSKYKFQFNKMTFSGHQVIKYNQFINQSLNTNYIAGKLKIFKSNVKPNSPNKLVGINPGASYGSAKCWPLKKYVNTINKLPKEFDIVILGGPNEIDIANKIVEGVSKSNRVISNYAGKTTVSELINLVSNLSLLITGDSGPMHIAAAFNIPTIAIFGPTFSSQTSQWKNENSVIIEKTIECKPCMKRVCPLGHHKCMEDIYSSEVVAEVHKIIN